jgi:hypothetical protein
MFLATSSLITTVLLHSSLVAAHARLGTLIRMSTFLFFALNLSIDPQLAMDASKT